jgi:hypothetical protein
MLNIARHLTLLALVVSGLPGCRHSTEGKLLGSWDVPAIDASSQITLGPDHNFEAVSSGMGSTFRIRGAWHVDGDQLVIRDEGREPISQTIVEITGNELRLKDAQGNEAFPWKRIR